MAITAEGAVPFPVDAQSIHAAEAKLGVSFPLSFVARMVRCNGGEVRAAGDVWHLYPFLDASDRRRLKRTCNDVVYETRWSRTHAAGFPQEAVAIAGNGGGDQLVLLPSEVSPTQLLEAVYVWNHETGDVVEIDCDMKQPAADESETGGGNARRRRTRG
jgi:hypothetical protein